MKKLIAIILVSVLALGAVGAVIGIVYMNKPEVVMKTAVKSLFDDVFEREDLETITNLFKSGSVEMILGASAEGNEVSLEFKEYFGLKNNETYIEKIKFSMNDFSVSGSAYLGEDYMYVSVPDLYKDPVGIVRGSTEKDFAKSVFAFDSGSDYELDEETTDIITILCRIYDDAQDKKVAEEVEEILTSYVELILDSIAEHGEVEGDKDSVKIHGKKVDARVITIEIDAECIINVARDLCDELQEDKRIQKFIKKYGGLVDDYVEGTVYEELISESDMDDATEAINKAYEDAIDMFDEGLSEIEENMDEIPDDLGSVVIEMATKKASSTLLALNVSTDMYGEKQEILDLQLGEDGAKKTDLITLSIMEDMAVVEFEVEQDDKNGYKSSMTVEADGEVICSFDIDLDNKSKEFSISVSAEGETYAVIGDYSKKGDTQTFDIKDVTYTSSYGTESLLADIIDLDETGVDFTFKIIICENDKPDPLSKGDVKSVFKLDEDDFEDMTKAVEDLAEDLMDAVGVGDYYDNSYSGFGS